MASWLKVAEDLLEVVDRRAKSVASDLVDEQTDSQPSGSNGQEGKAKRSRSKKKGQARQSANDTKKRSNVEQEQKSVQSSPPDVHVDKDETYPPPETSPDDGNNQKEEVSVEQKSDSKIDASLSDVKPSVTDTGIEVEAPNTDNDITITSSSTKDDVTSTDTEIMPDSSSSAPIHVESVASKDDRPADTSLNISSVDEDTSLKVNQASRESETVEKHNGSNSQEIESIPLPEASSNMNKQQDLKIGTTALKVQDQLDEAQGLLKTAVSTGQSKEARLAKVCAGLSSRLQEYKSENAQLEELLVSERERVTSYEARIKRLQQDLSASKLDVARVESSMSEALAAKNSEINSLVGSMAALKKQATASEEKLASLQENMEAVMRNRELTETRMIQALREELASVERRAEEERIAHNATKMAAVEREVELEHRAVEASNALARIQRTAEESTSRAADLEHKVALLEVECASLTQELQDMEARNRRGQKKSSEEASQTLQIQAWQEEVERARQGQRDAENNLSTLEAELQKMRVEMAGMKRDAEHYSRQEHMELEKRYRELTDLLYHKQTQLEVMASEKAAAEFQLEKEARRLREAQVEAERTKASRRSSILWEEDTDIKPLEDLPLHHRHMAGASMQLQKAAKLLDSGAVRATRFLWRYPIARILLLFYLVFVHFFLMYLLHQLQAQADDFASREVAASMGLGNTGLP